MMRLIECYLVAYLSVGFVIATWLTLTQYNFIKFVYKGKSNAFIAGVITGGFARNMVMWLPYMIEEVRGSKV